MISNYCDFGDQWNSNCGKLFKFIQQMSVYIPGLSDPVILSQQTETTPDLTPEPVQWAHCKSATVSFPFSHTLGVLTLK